MLLLKRILRERNVIRQFGERDLTVIENLMLAQMDILKRSKQEAYEKGVQLLKRVGLEGVC